jgi:hypothetical protein
VDVVVRLCLEEVEEVTLEEGEMLLLILAQVAAAEESLIKVPVLPDLVAALVVIAKN